MSRNKQKNTEAQSHNQNRVKPLVGKTRNQKTYIQSILSNDITFCTGPAGCGKAQPLDSIVYCKTGPKEMGDIEIGDIVCTPDGNFASVTDLHFQGEKDVYIIIFKNGLSVECCKDHLWLVEEYNGKNWLPARVVDTNYLLSSRLTYDSKFSRSKFRIKPSNVVNFTNKNNNEIDPYILGCLLGDGGITNGVKLTCHDDDYEIIKTISSRLTSDLSINKNKNLYQYSITSKPGKSNQLKQNLMKLNLFGHRSENKFIPHSYKYSDFHTRVDLIRGLMDTDGCISNDGKISFSSSSKKLAYDVKEVLESLGCIVSINTKETTNLLHYRLYIKDCQNIGLFNLSRKACSQVPQKEYTQYHYIKSIEYKGIEECQCITIDSQDCLYLTNNFIPTHNSFVAAGMASELLAKGSCEKIIVTRPLICTGKDIGSLPGELNEKIHPYMMPMYENLSYFFGNQFNILIERRKICFEPLELMRGMTYHNSIMILDEAQNCTIEQIKMFVTRMGENSKCLINGDIKQTDLNKDSGLSECISRVNYYEIPGIGICELEYCDIQRNDIISRFLIAMEE